MICLMRWIEEGVESVFFFGRSKWTRRVWRPASCWCLQCVWLLRYWVHARFQSSRSSFVMHLMWVVELIRFNYHLHFMTLRLMTCPLFLDLAHPWSEPSPIFVHWLHLPYLSGLQKEPLQAEGWMFASSCAATCGRGEEADSQQQIGSTIGKHDNRRRRSGVLLSFGTWATWSPRRFGNDQLVFGITQNLSSLGLSRLNHSGVLLWSEAVWHWSKEKLLHRLGFSSRAWHHNLLRLFASVPSQSKTCNVWFDLGSAFREFVVAHSEMICLSKMEIFHGYIKSPRGYS